MMDGRVLAIEKVGRNGFTDVGILSYAAKYAVFYDHSEVLWTISRLMHKRFLQDQTYQMDFHNSREAIDEALKDVDEGL